MKHYKVKKENILKLKKYVKEASINKQLHNNNGHSDTSNGGVSKSKDTL